MTKTLVAMIITSLISLISILSYIPLMSIVGLALAKLLALKSGNPWTVEICAMPILMGLCLVYMPLPLAMAMITIQLSAAAFAYHVSTK